MDAASLDTPEAEIAALRALLAERDAALAERDTELRNAGFEIEKLKVQLATLRRDRYGKPPGKLTAEISQLEMLIDNREEDEAQAAAAETKAKASPATCGVPHSASRCPSICRRRRSCMSRCSPAAAAARTRSA